MLETRIKQLTEAVELLTIAINAQGENLAAPVVVTVETTDEVETTGEVESTAEAEEKTNVHQIDNADPESLLKQCKTLARKKMSAGVDRGEIRKILKDLSATSLSELNAKQLKTFKAHLSKMEAA